MRFGRRRERKESLINQNLLLKIIQDSYSVDLSEDEVKAVEFAVGKVESKASGKLAPEDRISVAVYLGRIGVDMVAISKALDWHDFESLAAKACEEHGYSPIKNFRMKRPRTEIDVVAASNDLVICVDCKHWRNARGPATFERIAHSQIERTTRFMARTSLTSKPMLGVPVVATLLDECIKTVCRVPIVPIFQFADFLMGIRGSLEEVLTISRPD